jgi:hypothetical protein
MPRAFSPTTAEQLLSAVQAVVGHGNKPDSTFVSQFADLTVAQAEAALGLAVDMGLIAKSATRYSVKSPLCRFLDTFDQARRAAVLRILVETYEPFVVFRERLISTDSATEAARQTKTLLDLDAHREEVKDTLVSLGTYSRAFQIEAGGKYLPDPEILDDSLQDAADHCGDIAAAEARIRAQIGEQAAAAISRDDVIVPLSTALLRAKGADGVGAVVNAGNAVESFLDTLAAARGVNVVGAAGINARLDRFQQLPRQLPRKLDHIGRYLGHIRNAADHGTGDPDVNNASWSVRSHTGLEYVFVACSFISNCWGFHQGRNPPEI